MSKEEAKRKSVSFGEDNNQFASNNGSQVDGSSSESEEEEKNNIEIITDQDKINNTKVDGTFKLILIGDSGVGKTCII